MGFIRLYRIPNRMGCLHKLYCIVSDWRLVLCASLLHHLTKPAHMACSSSRYKVFKGQVSAREYVLPIGR